MKEYTVIPVRLSKPLVERVDRAVKLLGHGSRSGFIREAVERYVVEVESARILEVREVSIDEASKLIDRYLSKNPGVHYVSEVAERLGIELKTAFKAVEKMMKEGVVEAAAK